ncbi:ATP synthase F1 subunit delta [Oscillatoria sp. FACHB-1406]|uniref:ATP synthase F1 subunit delta n=1 Tax=Oscillatoria sp. FACHB-1406 TaxID=2692846 RepID=UPI0016832A06|nr:ATP synthase F1 subunit delta [Oscillatoria sp. FACHB-1406]MBD2579826.1 F0F1 ATP synthase subunit delta [Oscillatoria sp. FACHB-1406]
MKGSLLSSEIAEPYARALMDVAQSTNSTDALGEQIRGLVALMEESPELRDFVANPVVDAEAKKAVLRRVLGEGSNPYLSNFLMLLVDKRRVALVDKILEQFLALLRELNKTALAEVTAAKELSEEQKQQIIDRVKTMAGTDSVEIKTAVDPDLIGGVIIKVGSQVVDASVRGQLRQMTQRLKGNA